MARWTIPLAAFALLMGCGGRNEAPSSRDTATSDSSMMMRDSTNRPHEGMMGDSGGMMGHGRMDMASMNSMMVGALGPADSAYDQRFIDVMIPHHQGAIDMASMALGTAMHPELKAMAKNIIEAQQKEIEKMRSWRTAWYGENASSAMMKSPNMKMMNMSMMAQLGPSDSTFDLRFIDVMIPHHEGAIAMAQDALAKSRHAEIKDMAHGIIASQQKEIDQMKKWREKWYGK